MPPAPLPHNEASRLDAVCQAGLVTTPDPFTNSIAAVAATLSNCPIALATIVERDTQWFIGRHGTDNRRVITHHLTKAGASVTTAENGQDAQRRLQFAAVNRQPFDLIISDMQMPVMDGYTLARTLRADGCSLPIIALTANAMAEDERTCLDAGCNAYQSKPIDKTKLINACAALLAARPPAARAA